MQEIKIGLIKKDYGWERILNQEKVNWDLVSNLNKDKYSLIILNSIPKNENKLKKYLENGGAIISELPINFNSKRKIIKTKFGRLTEYKIGKGILLVLPFKLNKLILDKNSKRNLFPSPFTPPDELTPIVNKNLLREFIINCFIYLHNIRNIPYIHLWYYPFGYKNIFCFRMDVDREDLDDINKFYDLSQKFNMDFTWFVNCERCKYILNKIKYIFKQDVQSHGYIHEVFDTFEKNYKNLKLADKILNKKIIGFASPFGKWNYSLDKALNKLNYKYSSEFALDYNNFPFYPVDSKVLQIPIHPICVGSLVSRLYSERKMKMYFEYILSRLYERNIPLILYGHPTKTEGKYVSIIEHVLNIIKKSKNILCMTMTDFFNWWVYRNKVKFKVFYDKNKLRIIGSDKKIGLRIISENKENIIRLKKQTYNIKDEDFKIIPDVINYTFPLFYRLRLLVIKPLFYFKRILRKFFK